MSAANNSTASSNNRNNSSSSSMTSNSRFSSWYKWMSNSSRLAMSHGSTGFQLIYAYGRQVGWFVVTAGIITLLPLVFEIKREAVLEELERLHIGASLAEGKTPQELAYEGLTSAIEPKVLK